ncbi:GAF domain-containing protein [Actinoplanes sp. NPDC051346]|uniref:sensor histidine kinase n=1 Tax=Actinoplanes sp. NPDC051346 TaxID=3155048 RepID=UPI0034325500
MARSDLGLESLESMQGLTRLGRADSHDANADEHRTSGDNHAETGETPETAGIPGTGVESSPRTSHFGPAVDEPKLRRGALISDAADQVAALVARAVRARCGVVYFVDGDRLLLYGGSGLPFPRADYADIPIGNTLAGIVVRTGEGLAIDDLTTDDRVPADSPIRAHGLAGSYLGLPIRDEQGTVIGVCCAFDAEPRRWSDDDRAAVAEAAQVGTLLITERRATHEIDRQRRFLDAVLDSLHDGVTACDADGRILLVNARMQQLWEAARMPGDLDGDAVIANLTDGDGEPVLPDDISLYRALRGERLWGHDLIFSGRGRRTRHYVVDAQPIVGPDGRTLGAVQAVRDVTRRKRAERFRTCELSVITALGDAPSVAAAGSRVLEAIVSTLGWTHAELWLVDDAAGVLRSAAHWHVPEWSAEIEVPAELPYGTGLAGRAWQAGKPLWIRDVALPQSLISPETAAGSQLHAALALPVRNGLETLGVLTVFSDSAEEADDELVALLSGIAAHIGQFVERRMVEDLQRQLTRTKNEYLALVGHELRTPLTSIAAYTELLRDADSEMLVLQGPRMLEVIDRNTNRLRHIIDELLELSALDTGHARVQFAPVDLAEVVRESIIRTRKAVEGEPLTVEESLPDRLVLPGDRRRLGQVVDNLLGNAVRFSPDGGRVTVRLRAAGRAAELAVTDTGVDVPTDEREKMFTGLYRTSRTRDQAIPGSGLGLTLSRAVVGRHHGSIQLTEAEGSGITVLVRLPLDAR